MLSRINPYIVYHHLSNFTEKVFHCAVSSKLIERIQLLAWKIIKKMDQWSPSLAQQEAINIKIMGVIGCVSLAALLIITIFPVIRSSFERIRRSESTYRVESLSIPTTPITRYRN